MNNFSDSYRRLAALAEIASAVKVTQRSLAARLGISLGLANVLLRQLEADGLVKVRSSSSGASRYAVTRSGRAGMRKLSRDFAIEASAVLRKSLGGRAQVVRLLSRYVPMEAKRGL